MASRCSRKICDVKPKRGTVKRPKAGHLDGELRATEIADTPTLFRLCHVRPDGASRFIGLVEGTREVVTVVVWRLALRMRLLHDSGRRDRKRNAKRLPLIARTSRRRRGD